MGRFVSADDRIVDNSNLFSYCLNNPIMNVDFSGNEVGDLFLTPDDAARDFARCYNMKSIAEDREYASVIYAVIKVVYVREYHINKKTGIVSWVYKQEYITMYTYSTIIKGTAHSVQTPLSPSQNQAVADIHTHGSYSDFYSGDHFSMTDIRTAEYYMLTSYLVTPLGLLRKYDPKTNEDIIIFTDFPYDPNHPRRKMK